MSCHVLIRFLDAQLDWRAEEELDSLLAIVLHLIKSADVTVLRVLRVLTDQWFKLLENVLKRIVRQLPFDQQRGDDTHDDDAAIYSRNRELFLSSGRCV